MSLRRFDSKQFVSQAREGINMFRALATWCFCVQSSHASFDSVLALQSVHVEVEELRLQQVLTMLLDMPWVGGSKPFQCRISI